jgi:hypothetical protein
LHDKIVKILFELCKETKTNAGRPVYSSIKADHIGQKYKPIILTAHITKHKPLARNYSPDVWAQIKKKRLFDICEVWHSETEGEAVEDILFSSLVGGIRYLHIVCTGGNLTSEDAEELVDLILNRIRDEEGKKLLDPNGSIYIVNLPEKLWNDEAKIKRHLKKELQF